MGNSELISIGELSDASGISIDTIRVWERRYGRPVPQRLPSGHRRYNRDQVRWMRRIAEALAAGMRPSKVVNLPEAELTRIIESRVGQQVEHDVSDLLELVKNFEGARLKERLQHERSVRGIAGVVDDVIAPLVVAVGRAWADGTLEVRHEHYLSQVLEDFLRGCRADLQVDPSGATVVLATLSGETHGLGIQMAAVHCLLCGARPHILGPDVPNEQIAATVIENRTRFVALSVSLATGGLETDRKLVELRGALPEDVTLIIGGRGARGVRRGPRGVVYAESFGEFQKLITAAADSR